MTTIDHARPNLDARGIPCPDWCLTEGGEYHGDLHESRVWGIDLPDRGPAAPMSLHVGLVTDATGLLARASRPDVTLHDGDDLLVSIPASAARSLAALLVHAADVAEGLR